MFMNSNSMKKRGSAVSLVTFVTSTSSTSSTASSPLSEGAEEGQLSMSSPLLYEDDHDLLDEEVGGSQSSLSSTSEGGSGDDLLPTLQGDQAGSFTVSTHQRRRAVLSGFQSSCSLVHMDDKPIPSQRPVHEFSTPKRKDSEQPVLNSQRSSSFNEPVKPGAGSLDSHATDAPLSDGAPSPPASSGAAVVVQTKAFQLVVGAMGIYGAYLYYGLVQEDLFRYHNAVTGQGFTHVWALQVLESAVTMVIGYAGRKVCGGRDNLPLAPFFKSGASQLAAKALMSLSLSAGLSFPVVTLAKSAKIVPVMLGQLLMGGSTYSMRDYTFAILIVMGTALLSAGGKTTETETPLHHSNTASGLVLIFLSLTADGFTGGLQKQLKRVTASMAPTTYDFLYYSHMAQWLVALVICVVTGELWAAPVYLMQNPMLWWLVLASCVCSAVGQCFIFYVISCFDPLVCTTITTTRKVLTVMLSITFKGHDLTEYGCLGLGLACTALLVEVEGQVTAYRKRKQKKSSGASAPAIQPTSGNSSNTSGAVPLLPTSIPLGTECKMTQ